MIKGIDVYFKSKLIVCHKLSNRRLNPTMVVEKGVNWRIQYIDAIKFKHGLPFIAKIKKKQKTMVPLKDS